MAIFGKKKEEEKVDASVTEQATEAKPVKETVAGLADRNLSAVIVRPIITEKAAVLGEKNVYTFEVHQDATKYDVRDAVKELFKVEPKRVNVVKQKPRVKMSRMRGRKSKLPGMKKAYVMLKDGDRIDLV